MRFLLIIAGLIVIIAGLVVAVSRRPAADPGAGPVAAGAPIHPAPAAGDRSPVVATVDGVVITLRQLEDELLRREGRETLEELVRQRVKQIDWTALLRDEAVVLVMPDLRLTRGDLLKALGDEHQRLTSEMIQITAAEQHLRREGIVIDQPMIDAELRRMRSQLARRIGDNTQIDLESMIRQQKGQSLEEFTREPGFRTLVVGVRALAEKHLAARATDDELRKVFDADRKRYHLPEAVDLSDIYIPYRPAEESAPAGPEDAQARKAIERSERARLAQVQDLLHGQLKADLKRFGMLWRTYARSYEKDADENGRIGWVRRDGTRDTPGARVLDRNVVSIAFACAGPFPQLLPPIAHDQGIDLVVVHGRRVAQDPEFAAVKARVRADWIEAQLDGNVKRISALIAASARAVRQPDGSLRLGDATLDTRRVATAVLSRHGAAEAERQVGERLGALDWGSLGDETVLIDLGVWSIRRGQLAGLLLADQGAQVREEMIKRIVLERAFARQSLVIDQAAQDAAVAVLEYRYRASDESQRISFRDFVLKTQGATLEEFVRQPAFHLIAGLHLLVDRQARAEIDEDRLREAFAQRAARYGVRAGVDLALVWLPLPRQAGKDGRPLPVSDADRAALAVRARTLHADIRAGRRTLQQAWAEHGRQFDAYEAPGGRLGWVDRDGRREGARATAPVPKAVVAAAFAAAGPYPVLLPPLIDDDGASLVEVHGRRDDHQPTLAEVRERVFRDLVMSDYDRRCERATDEARRLVEVDYGERGLTELIDERREALGKPRTGK